MPVDLGKTCDRGCKSKARHRLILRDPGRDPLVYHVCTRCKNALKDLAGFTVEPTREMQGA